MLETGVHPTMFVQQQAGWSEVTAHNMLTQQNNTITLKYAKGGEINVTFTCRSLHLNRCPAAPGRHRTRWLCRCWSYKVLLSLHTNLSSVSHQTPPTSHSLTLKQLFTAVICISASLPLLNIFSMRLRCSLYSAIWLKVLPQASCSHRLTSAFESSCKYSNKLCSDSIRILMDCSGLHTCLYQ